MFWRTNECSIPNCMLFEAQESQKRETISSHVELLRASTNCQMQTNILNNLKLIYCTGKTVGLKKTNTHRFGSGQQVWQVCGVAVAQKSLCAVFVCANVSWNKAKRQQTCCLGFLVWLELGCCVQLWTHLCQRGVVRRKQRGEHRNSFTKGKIMLNNDWVRDIAEDCKYLNGVNLPNKEMNYLGCHSKAEWSNYNKGYF